MSQPENDLPGIVLPADLAVTLERASLRLGRFAGRVRYLAETGSTNDVASRLAAAGAPEGTTVVAAAQTAGRGRIGRTWFSPPGAGLYFSFVLRPGAAAGRGQSVKAVHLMTLAIGVALAEALRLATGLSVNLKWPNDLLVGRRKLGGILAEAVDIQSASGYVVVGCGLNLRTAVYPPDVAARATSIEAELGRSVERGVVLAESLAAIEGRVADLEAERFGVILSRWLELSPSATGTRVRWVTADGERTGTTAGVDGDGALLLRTDRGVERVLAGDILWI